MRVFPCALELSRLWVFMLFLFLYLCRAACGSADIPILPHAHTILLKHAVNLKRKRTLFTSKRLYHHPIVLPTSRCQTNIGFSQNSGEAGICSAWCHVPESHFVYRALSSTLGVQTALCCWKNAHLSGASPLILPFFPLKVGSTFNNLDQSAATKMKQREKSSSLRQILWRSLI